MTSTPVVLAGKRTLLAGRTDAVLCSRTRRHYAPSISGPVVGVDDERHAVLFISLEAIDVNRSGRPSRGMSEVAVG